MNLERRSEHWSSTQLAVDKTPGILLKFGHTVPLLVFQILITMHDNFGPFKQIHFLVLESSYHMMLKRTLSDNVGVECGAYFDSGLIIFGKIG